MRRKRSYPEEVRCEADRGVYGDHEEQADDVYEQIRIRRKAASTKKTYSAALVSAQTIVKIRDRLGGRG